MMARHKYPEDYPFYYPPTGSYARFMEPNDVLGAIILCPHCGQMLKIIEAGPGVYPGFNVELGKLDRWWFVKLEDGTTSRFWMDGKVIVGPEVSN